MNPIQKHLAEHNTHIKITLHIINNTYNSGAFHEIRYMIFTPMSPFRNKKKKLCLPALGKKQHPTTTAPNKTSEISEFNNLVTIRLL